MYQRPVRFFQSSGPPLHVERRDAGSPACVLIHGGGDGAFVWDLFAPALARSFTTLAVDLRGHGESGWDPSGDYSTSGYVSDVAHVIDHSGLSTFILIGHSLGARIAIHLRALYPERVLASVLVDYAPELDPGGIQQAELRLRQSLKVYPTINHYADWLKETCLLVQPALLEHVAACALRAGGDGFHLKVDPAVADSFCNTRSDEAQLLWSLLKRQSCPTLVVRGGGSAVLTRSMGRRVIEVLPRSELATVDCAGHSVMLDSPFEFERAVLAFLEKLPSSRLRECSSYPAVRPADDNDSVPACVF